METTVYNNELGHHKQYEPGYLQPEDVVGCDLTKPHTMVQMNQQLQSFDARRKLLDRKFVSVESASASAKPSFRVMQWNVLAQGLSGGDDNFILCPKDALQWETRRLSIAEEILTYQPDVVCLEEVDHFGFLNQILENVGFEGTFYPKPDSPALSTPESNGPDGCAVFFLKDRFKLLAQHKLVLKEGQEFSNQVCIIQKLADQTSGKNVVVCVTHLKAKPSYHARRKSQGDYVLGYLAEHFPNEAVVFCGDFNADPDEEVITGFSSRLQSSYKLLSETKDTEPPFTTCKFRRGKQPEEIVESRHTIDYIWFCGKSLFVKSLLSLPTLEEIGEKGLPSPNYPSDHLSLVAEFTSL